MSKPWPEREGATDPAVVQRVLRALAGEGAQANRGLDVIVLTSSDGRRLRASALLIDELIHDDLARWIGDRRLALTDAGRARLARAEANEIDGFTAQHAELRETVITDEGVAHRVLLNDGESTLAWLRRRKGPDGQPLISDAQFAAGERLRAELERAMIMPRVTANWSAAVASDRRGAERGEPTEMMIASRQRVDRAMDAVGPEFAGLLIDVCGFLKRLPEIERDRGWPARSAKLLLDLALTRLARHYGLAAEARGPERAPMRFWGAGDYRPSLDAASP